jgi:microcystin-dependent protein
MTETTETTQLGAAYSTATGSVPIGTILPYGGLVSGSSQGTLDLQGYLFCDGTAISRTGYNELFSVIGNFFGAGDSVNTFNLPNLQGLFLRGVSHGSGNDPDANSRTASGPNGNTGDNVGSYQGDAFASHTHTYSHTNLSTNRAAEQKNGMPFTDFSSDSTTGSQGGSETRPKNIYVNYIIKAKNV